MRQPRKLKTGWQGRITANGKDKTIGVYPTKKAAMTAQAEAITKLENPEQIVRVPMTVAEFAPIYLMARTGELKPGSIKNYEAHLRLHVLPHWGHRQLRDIRATEVSAWWTSLEKKPSTKSVYRTFSNLMRCAVDDEHITSTPCRVKKVGTDLTKPRPYLAPEVLTRLLEAADDDMKSFLLVIYGGALRISEALGLEHRHVDLTTGRILVEQQLIPGSTRTIGTTKNGESRTVMLGASGLAAAKSYAKRHRTFGQGNPFFVNERGEQLSKNAIYKKWRVIRIQAGVPHARIHDLRHASLTELAQVGGTMADVMAFGGHKDHRSAQRYQHASDDRMAALVALRKEAV